MQKTSGRALLREIPAVSRLLAGRPVAALTRRLGITLVTDLLREDLEDLRRRVAAGELTRADLRREAAASKVAGRLEARSDELLAPRPVPVINATGIVVHTNLGRAPLSRAAADRVARLACGYMDLEYDLAQGRRGQRMTHLEPLMQRLFPGSGFAVLNNNAAAILLCLRALARRKEVVLSRGELVEIGGSFRVPDILAASGAKLREVGTTNRTRLADYAAAVGPRTGLILKVHTSNFRIVGFSEETTIADLSGLTRKHEVPLVVDWGSGDLVDLAPLGIHDELPVLDVLEAPAPIWSHSAGTSCWVGRRPVSIVGRQGSDRSKVRKRSARARVCGIDRSDDRSTTRHADSAYVRGRAFEDVPTLRMLALTAG